MKRKRKKAREKNTIMLFAHRKSTNVRETMSSNRNECHAHANVGRYNVVNSIRRKSTLYIVCAYVHSAHIPSSLVPIRDPVAPSSPPQFLEPLIYKRVHWAWFHSRPPFSSSVVPEGRRNGEKTNVFFLSFFFFFVFYVAVSHVNGGAHSAIDTKRASFDMKHLSCRSNAATAKRSHGGVCIFGCIQCLPRFSPIFFCSSCALRIIPIWIARRRARTLYRTSSTKSKFNLIEWNMIECNTILDAVLMEISDITACRTWAATTFRLRWTRTSCEHVGDAIRSRMH